MGGSKAVTARFGQGKSPNLLSWHGFFLHIISIFGDIHIKNDFILLTFSPALANRWFWSNHHFASSAFVLDLENSINRSFISKEIIRRLNLILLGHDLH